MRDESRIRQLFNELRREDDRSVPRFDEVLNRTSERKNTPVFLTPPVKAVLALVFLVALVLPAMFWIDGSDREANQEISIADLYEWEAPSDFLLAFPSEELLTEVPSIEIESSDWTSSNDERNEM